MPLHIPQPTRVAAIGEPPKIIEEFFGQVASHSSALSIARLRSPSGWSEPGQTPEFDEYTVVLHGELQVETRESVFKVVAGQAILTHKDEWIRYSTPGPDGAEYLAICLPAFSPGTVHRDA